MSASAIFAFTTAVYPYSSSTLSPSHFIFSGSGAVARVAHARRVAAGLGLKLVVVRPFGHGHWSVWVSLTA